MASVAERIYDLVKALPESKAERVLGYVQGLMDDGAPALPVTEEEHQAWCERLRKLVESKPMTEGDTVARMRQEATVGLITSNLLPSMEDFRQSLPLQPIGAGEFCRAMRDGERF